MREEGGGRRGKEEERVRKGRKRTGRRENEDGKKSEKKKHRGRREKRGRFTRSGLAKGRSRDRLQRDENWVKAVRGGQVTCHNRNESR